MWHLLIGLAGATTIDLNDVLLRASREVVALHEIRRVNSLVLDGHYAQGLTHAERLTELAMGLRAGVWAVEAYRVRAALAMELGDFEDARSSIRMLRAHLDEVGMESERERLRAHAILLEVRLADLSGQGDPGWARLDEARAILAAAGQVETDASLASLFMQRQLAQGRVRDAAAIAVGWEPRYDAAGILTELVACRALSSVGRTAAARERLGAVLATAERRRWDYPAAAAHGELARIYEDSGAVAQAQQHATASLGYAMGGDAWESVRLATRASGRFEEAERWFVARPALEHTFRVSLEADRLEAWARAGDREAVRARVEVLLHRPDLVHPADDWGWLLALGSEAGSRDPELASALDALPAGGLRPATGARVALARARLRPEQEAGWLAALDATDLAAAQALGGPEERAAVARAADDAVDALVALRAGRGDWLGAVEAMERGRARANADWLAGVPVLPEIIPPNLQGEIGASSRALAIATAGLSGPGMRLAETADATRDVGPVRVDWALVRRLGAQLDTLYAEARAETGTPAPGQAPLAVDRLRSLPGEGEVLVTWHLTEDRAWVVAWDREGVSGGPVEQAGRPVGRSALAALVAAAVATARDGDPAAVRASMATLAEVALGPVAARLEGARHVTLLPHGPLHGAPFGALPVRGGWLGAQATVVVAPSASALARARAGLRPFTPGPVLLVGDPRGDLAAARADVLGLTWPGEVTRLVGADAEEARVSAMLPGAGTALLSTHGEFFPEAPKESFLLLAPGPTSDGRLSVRELGALRLHAGLVVLAACSSGVSEPIAPGGGDDRLGLATALGAAGADRVLSTLWPVRDADAHIFNTRFAAELARGGTVAEAQRRTVAALAGETPAVWAAWSLYDPESPR